MQASKRATYASESHPSQKSRMLSPRRVAKAVDGSKYRCRVIFNIRERPKKIRPFTEESLSHNNRVFSREYPIPNRVEPVGQALTQRKELKSYKAVPAAFHWYLVEPKADAQKKQSEAYFQILTGDSILSSLWEKEVTSRNYICRTIMLRMRPRTDAKSKNARNLILGALVDWDSDSSLDLSHSGSLRPFFKAGKRRRNPA